MSFESVNRAIKTAGGDWVNLKDKGQRLSGKLLNIDERDQKDFKTGGQKISQAGNVRKEWVLTLETSKGNVKTSLKENGQSALRDALKDAGETEIKPNATIDLVVMKPSTQSPPVAAELKARYTAPAFDAGVSVDEEDPFAGSAEDDEPPF